MNRFGLATAMVIAAVSSFSSKSYAWGIEFQDTYLSIRYLPEDKQPGNEKDVNFVAGNIAYANGWTYGSNFVSLDLEDIGRGDLSNSVTNHANSNSFEFYGVFRSTLSGNKIFGGDQFSFGPIRDVGLTIGLDLDTQNDQFASYKRLITFGPQFSINLPRGFWNITTGLSHEWNTDAYLPNGNGTNFQTTWTIENAWAFPFAVGPFPLNFTGFANIVGPKGRGANSDFYHKVEILVHPKLMLDVGTLIGYAPKKLEAGVGFEYWHHKFGDVKPYVNGTEQRSVFVEVGYHF